MRSFQLLAAALSGEIIAPVLPAGKLRRREGGSSEFLQGGQLGSQEEKERKQRTQVLEATGQGICSFHFVFSFPFSLSPFTFFFSLSSSLILFDLPLVPTGDALS